MSMKTLFIRRQRGGTRRRTTRVRPAYRPSGLERLEDLTLLSGNPLGHHEFGIDGKVTTSFSGALNESAATVLVQPDGKIVAVGTAYNQFALARYTSTGALDQTYGTGGKVT